jgi:hypothetical protein
MRAPDAAETPVVTFLFNYGRVRRLGDDTPAEFFYGFRGLPIDRFRTALLEPHPPSQGLIDAEGTVYPAPAPVRWLTMKLKPTGLAQITRCLQLGFCGLAALRRASVVVCVTSPWLHAMGVLRRCRLVRRPTVAIVIGPFGEGRDLRGRLRNRLRRALDSTGELIFLGEGDLAGYLANINPTPNSATLIQFGVDAGFWRPAEDADGGDGYAFSIGNAGRDYAALLDVWRDRTTPLRIVTNLLDPQRDYGAAVCVRHGIWHSTEISDADVRALYQGARYVVTPLVESPQPCGQSATLQAMACGKAVILTRSSGLWDTTNLRHMENCLFIAPGDTAGLAAAVDYLERRPDECRRLGANARETVERHFTAAMFAQRLGALIDGLLQREPARTA